MIRLVTGALGGGKTLHCVGLMVAHLAKGGTLYTNVEIYPDKIAEVIRRRYRRIIEQDQIRFIDLVKVKDWQDQIDWGDDGGSVLVVLDEIHLHFNSRDWAKTQKLHADMLGFISQSRKCDVDIVFIAQVASQLEKQFRDQCEWEFFCRSLKTVRVPVLGYVPLNRMILIQRDKHTDKPVDRQLLNYDRGLFGCYNTKAFLDGAMQAAALVKTRVTWRKLKRVPAVSRQSQVALLLAAVLCVFYYLVRK